MRVSNQTYVWFYDNIQSRYYDLLVKWCFLPFGGESNCRKVLIEDITFGPGEKILDMCCGTGGTTKGIIERSASDSLITGIDISSGQLNKAKQCPELQKVEFIQGDVVATRFPDGYFDKVLISHALHEMYREQRLRVLTEARRIVGTGGEVIILEMDRPASFWRRMWVGFWWFYWLPFNYETPTRRDMIKCGLENEAKLAGFAQVHKYSKFNGAFQTLVCTV